MESLNINFAVDWVASALIEADSEAEKAGIQSGDKIVTINDKSIANFDLYLKLHEWTQVNPDQAIKIDFLRNDERLTTMLTPQVANGETFLDLRGFHWELLMSGLEFTVPPPQIPEYNPVTALRKGIDTNWSIFKAVIKMLRRLITREVSPKFLSGPIGIVDVTSRIVQIGFMSLLFFIGFISVNLAIVNLLPIPIADGGQILFFTLEKVRGKPLSVRTQSVIQQVSIVFIAGLFLYITFYDVLRVLFA